MLNKGGVYSDKGGGFTPTWPHDVNVPEISFRADARSLTRGVFTRGGGGLLRIRGYFPRETP